jgi:hypothetical protein
MRAESVGFTRAYQVGIVSYIVLSPFSRLTGLFWLHRRIIGDYRTNFRVFTIYETPFDSQTRNDDSFLIKVPFQDREPDAIFLIAGSPIFLQRKLSTSKFRSI